MAHVSFSGLVKVTVKITQLAEFSNCMQRGSSFEIPLRGLRLNLKNEETFKNPITIPDSLTHHGLSNANFGPI